MYEFEFWDAGNQELLILHGYSQKDVERRNPEIDFSKLTLRCAFYVD